MKSKRILITIVAVVVVVAATFGITYAAWDKPADQSSLNATVGNNVNINVTQTGTGDANTATLVPKNTPNTNATMKDCLTLGAVKVTNNPVNNSSSDTDSLNVIWDVKAISVTYVNTTDAVTMDVALFKTLFNVTIQFGDAQLSNYGGVVPMDIDLSVLLEFVDNTDTISDESARKFREAKFVVTVEFTAVAKA